VLIAGGDGLARAGLRAILDGDSAIAVVADAATGDDAVALALRWRPDVALIGSDLLGIDGLETARAILDEPELAQVKVLMLVARDSDADLLRAVRAGVSGVIVSDSDAVDLCRAVRVVAAGGAQLSPSLTRRLIEELAGQPDPQLPTPEELEELTARELEVLTLVALGLTNGEIAERLVVSPATAKTHVSRAMIKLHAHDRAKLVRIAYEAGLVQPRARAADLPPGPGAPLRSLAAA
jgi:DNA-binding NarL/FixJ family response regulator